MAKIRLTNNPVNRSLLSLLTLTMIIFLGLNIIAFNLEGVATLSGAAVSDYNHQGQASPPRWPGEVAQALHQLGIQPGTKVAVIGYAFDSFWARLARVQIVAEMLGEAATPFWLSDERQRDEVYQAFASTGAKAIVAEYVPDYAKLPDWHQVGNSNFYIYVLH